MKTEPQYKNRPKMSNKTKVGDVVSEKMVAMSLNREEAIDVVMKRTGVTLDGIASLARTNRTSVFFWKRGLITRNSNAISEAFRSLTGDTKCPL